MIKPYLVTSNIGFNVFLGRYHRLIVPRAGDLEQEGYPTMVFDRIWRKTSSEKAEDPVEQLFYGDPPQPKTETTLELPAVVEPCLQDFFKQTELLHQFLTNRCGREWSYEQDTSIYVHLGTYDGPERGRNFTVFYNAARVGQISIVPNMFPEDEGWADLRLRLQYPIEHLPSSFVFQFLAFMASTAIDCVGKPTPSERAKSDATQAMAMGLWDAKIHSNATVIDLTVSGSFAPYFDFSDRWKNKNFENSTGQNSMPE